MSKVTNADRAAICRDGWSRAYVAAIQAEEPVRAHIGAGLREAWAEFRGARAEGRVLECQTAEYDEREGRSLRAEARVYLKTLLLAKVAAVPVQPVNPRQVMRGIILKRIDVYAAAMTHHQAELDRDIAVYGMSALTDRTHDRLDELHTQGINLRSDLADINAGGIRLVPAGHHPVPADATRIARLRAQDAALTREIEGFAAAAQEWVEGRDGPGAGDAVQAIGRFWEKRERLRVKINSEEAAVAARITAPVQLDLVTWLATAPAMVPPRA